MTEKICGLCKSEAENTICWNCQLGFRQTLLELRDLIDELETQISRQARNAPGEVGVGKSSEEPLPFDLGASLALDEVNTTLMFWATPPVGMDKYSGALAMADELLSKIPYFATTKDAPDLVTDVRKARSKAMRAVDREVAKVPLGECDCGRTVHARAEARFYRCRCGVLYSVEQTRRRLRELGAEQLVTAREAERLGDVRGVRLLAGTVNKWRARGQILCRLAGPGRGCDHPGNDHVYRFGDLLERIPDPAAAA